MRLTAVVVLALLLSPLANSGVVLIAVNQEDRVMLVDDRNYKELASVKVGAGPHEIAVSPDGRRAYVADSGRGPEGPKGNTVTVIDVRRRRVVATWNLGEHQPHDLIVSANGKRLYVAAAPTQAALEIDTATGKILRAHKTGRDGGWMIAVSDNDRYLFIAHLEHGGITIIDRASGQVEHVQTAEGEMGFADVPKITQLWAANSRTHQISVIDAAAKQVVETFPSSAKVPVRVRFTPDGRRAVITHGDPRQLTVFDFASKQVIGRVPLPHGPKIVALDARGTRAFVSHPSGDSVSVVDLNTLKIIATIKTGKQPDGVAFAR